jgi:hypothetical protein
MDALSITSPVIWEHAVFQPVYASVFGGYLFAFWPFDFSCSGFIVIGLVMLWWLCWSAASAAKDAANAAKKLAENETVREAGKGILAAWLESLFKK